MDRRLLVLILGLPLVLSAGCFSSGRHGAGGSGRMPPDPATLAPYERKILELIAITDELSAGLARVNDLATATAAAQDIRAATGRIRQLSNDLKQAEQQADWLTVTWLKLKYRGPVAEFKGRLDQQFKRIAAQGPEIDAPISQAMQQLKEQLKNKDSAAPQPQPAEPSAP